MKEDTQVKAKGIFCLEADWWNDLKKPSSVQPMLTLLNHSAQHRVPSIHRDVESGAALLHYLDKWSQKQYADYPILYLPLHGGRECLLVGDRRFSGNTVTLGAVADALAGKCKGRVLFFAGCNVLETHGNRLNGFVRKTDAVAFCGYRGSVDWLEGVAFEILVLGVMQRYAFTAAGAAAMKRAIAREAGDLARRLGFRMEVRS